MPTRWNSKTVHWRDCVWGCIEIDPKSWWALNAEACALTECRSMLEALATACALGLVDLFRLEMLSEADFTESTDWKNNAQRTRSRTTDDCSELGIWYVGQMGCWEVVDIPPDAQLLGVRWVFKSSAYNQFTKIVCDFCVLFMPWFKPISLLQALSRSLHRRRL